MHQTDIEIAGQRARQKLAEYASGRASDVGRGAETPQLAALLLQKYGYGLCDGLHVAFDGSRDPALPTYADVDAAVSSINPEWQATDRLRWQARPAALAL